MSFEDDDTYCDEMTQQNTQFEESQALIGEVVKETQDQHDDETNDLNSDEVEGTPQSCLHNEKTDSTKQINKEDTFKKTFSKKINVNSCANSVKKFVIN